jgi:PAS domain S-box-containing protein
VIWPSDGSMHVISARGKVYRDAAGRAVRMTGVCSDITERRRIEDQLERERNLLRALMDNIPDNIYFKDLASRFVQINAALAKLFKLGSPEEAIGRTDFDFFTAEHARAAYADEQEVIRSGEPMIGKVENESLPDDRTSWSLTTKMPLRDQHGQIVGTFGISRDITRLRRAAEALRESEQRYGRLLDTVTDYVYTVTMRDGQVIGTSHGPGCLAVTGYRPDEFQNDAWLWHRIIHPEDQNLVVENINRMLEEKAPRAIEHRIIRRDGAVRWVRNKQVAHCDDAGQLLSYDGLVSDITERKQAEAQVHEGQCEAARCAR